MGAEAIAIQIK